VEQALSPAKSGTGFSLWLFSHENTPLRDIREVEPGVYSVIDGARSWEVRIANGDVRVNGMALEVHLDDPRAWNARGAHASLSGAAQVKAPMAGKVVRVLVAPGDQVGRGQGVIVVEAMKMQNELKSPRDGRVTAIAAKDNQVVNAGAVLVTIE
jgi:biotin carboxyl carrier protein